MFKMVAVSCWKPRAVVLNCGGGPIIQFMRRHETRGESQGAKRTGSSSLELNESDLPKNSEAGTSPSLARGSPSGFEVTSHSSGGAAETPGSVSSSSTSPGVRDNEERRRRNTEASARFRVKRRMRVQAMEKQQMELIRKIEDLEVQVKTLEMENECLKQMLLGKSSKDGSSGTAGDSRAEGSLGVALGSVSNLELLDLLRKKSGDSFRITR